MYLLYPRLPLAIAVRLVSERSSMTISDLAKISGTEHTAVQYYETGSKVSKGDLKKIQSDVRICAGKFGYPDPSGEQNLRSFDTECGQLLHQSLKLHPSEASHLEMWAFLTCVLLPDVVRWRFPGDATTEERFIGSDRGLRRNTFGRLWWRSHLMHQPNSDNPYEFFDLLHEDDLVQITERNSIAASRTLIAVFVQAFIKALTEHQDIPRRELMRETVKRVRRYLSFIAFDLLDEKQIRILVDTLFEQTAEALLNPNP
ncbi:MAG: hypothetical protein Kow0080_34510 [Candidatus Promineifilaceae bacterium]